MKIVTWNINSIRLRVENIKRLILETDADIICLQETKVQDADFPLVAIQSLGYPYVEFSGEKSYNGVAILSRLPLEHVECFKLAGKQDARHISAFVNGEFWLHNFYVPAGGDVPDPMLNDKFAFKLAYLDAMSEWFIGNHLESDKIILVGDLNVAPCEHDVWSSRQLKNVVSHTEIEIKKLRILQNTLKWYDVARHINGDAPKIYSWWSYRNKDWRKSNRGRRLDHIWATGCIIDKITNFHVMIDARDWDLPSDHVPVLITL